MDTLLDNRQGQKLLKLARNTLAHILEKEPVLQMPDEPALSVKAAVFVTLKKNGQLRGCIGNLEPVGALWEAVRDNTLNAALHDYRFSPLTSDELPVVQLSISILSQPKPLDYEDIEDLPAKLRPGIDGVILRDGRRSATFLPQVWQQLDSPEQFLGHLCQKAGLPQETWQRKKLEIYTYQVQSFEEERQ